MLGTQLFHAGVTADLEPFVEDDAAILEALDAAHDDILFQLESGDAIGQQAAGAVVPVIDMDFIARDAQIFGGGEAGGAGADDADRLAARGAGDERFDPAFLPGGVGDELFHRADGDRSVAGKFDHAIAFAQTVLRADAAADFRHGAGQVRQLIGFAQAPFGGQAQPVGDMIVQRAMGRAIGHAALRAARRLFLGLVQNEGLADFQKVLSARISAALFRIGLFLAHELQHRIFSHGISLQRLFAVRIAGKPAESRGFWHLRQLS